MRAPRPPAGRASSWRPRSPPPRRSASAPTTSVRPVAHFLAARICLNCCGSGGACGRRAAVVVAQQPQRYWRAAAVLHRLALLLSHLVSDEHLLFRILSPPGPVLAVGPPPPIAPTPKHRPRRRRRRRRRRARRRRARRPTRRTTVATRRWRISPRSTRPRSVRFTGRCFLNSCSCTGSDADPRFCLVGEDAWHAYMTEPPNCAKCSDYTDPEDCYKNTDPSDPSAAALPAARLRQARRWTSSPCSTCRGGCVKPTSETKVTTEEDDRTGHPVRSLQCNCARYNPGPTATRGSLVFFGLLRAASSSDESEFVSFHLALATLLSRF